MVFRHEGSSGIDIKREGSKELLSFVEADSVDAAFVDKTERLTKETEAHIPIIGGCV